MTYEEQSIVIDMVGVIAIPIIFLMIFGLLSVGLVLGVVSVGVIIMVFRLWKEKRSLKKIRKEEAEWKWDLIHPEMKAPTKD